MSLRWFGGKRMMDDETPAEGSRAGSNRPYRTGFLNAEWADLRDEPDKRVVQRTARRENVLEYPSRYYHYTTLPGFHGIVESEGFWASDNRFMNDAQETLHGRELTAAIVTRYAARRSSDCFAPVLRAAVAWLREPVSIGHLVACFSRARDDLEQWRAYGPSGGVCIGLGEPTAGARPIFIGPDTLPFKVMYRGFPKARLVLSIVRRFAREYALDRLAMPDEWPDDHDSLYAERLGSLLAYRCLVFKHAAFRNEAELRIVVSQGNADRFGGLSFRPTALGIVPYVCTAAYGPKGPLPIQEVIIGPSPHQALIAASVETYLSARGYSHVAVVASAVPYRHL